MSLRLSLVGLVMALMVGILSAPPVHAQNITFDSSALDPNRYASIVVDYETSTVLRSRRADVRLHPASLTKMMTMLLVFEALDRGELRLDSTLRASTHAASMPRSNIELSTGDTLTVDQGLRALAVRSAMTWPWSLPNNWAAPKPPSPGA